MADGAPPPGGAQAETLRIVVQRVSSGRLIVNAETDRWASVPSPGGLVLLTGFQVEKESTTGCDDGGLIDAERLRRAAHSLLASQLASGDEAGWQEDHSETTSIAALVGSSRRVCVTMIPQACLAGVIPLGQKSIKYNRQVEKDRARELWLRWVSTVASKLVELVCPPSEEELAAAKRAEAMATMKAKAEAAPADPKMMFKEGTWAGKFSSFAEDGLPLTEADTGEAVKKSQLKKLTRIHEQQKVKWERWLSKQGAEQDTGEKDGGAAMAEQTPCRVEEEGVKTSEPLAAWLSSDPHRGGALIIRSDGTASRLPEDASEVEPADGERARLVWGTFGGRQSWEAKSTGPFTHAVNF